MEQIRETAQLLKDKKKIIACWAMGLTQHKNAVDTIKEIVNLLLMKGSIGKPGAGTCPVRGHSNVQGDRTMGIYEKPSAAFLKALKAISILLLLRIMVTMSCKAINAMHEGKAKLFLAMGGNFLSATPDTTYTAQALTNCDLTVTCIYQAEPQPSRSWKRSADIAMPGRSRQRHSERGGTICFLRKFDGCGAVVKGSPETRF